jgi:hypothetical protein
VLFYAFFRNGGNCHGLQNKKARQKEIDLKKTKPAPLFKRCFFDA